MQQWSDPYNGFNPFKVLLHRQHLEGCAKDDYLPPVMANTYLTNLCEHRCAWCLNWGWRQKTPSSMPSGHALKLAEFYKKWGIKATCLGGGESTMHDDFAPFLYKCKELGIEVGVATNGGSHLDKDKLKAMAECTRWVGISVDAGDAVTHSCLHNVPNTEFAEVMQNMRKLATMGADVTYKMLIHPLNIATIYAAAAWAKHNGASGIMMRPVGWENVERTKGLPPLDFAPYLKRLEEQVQAARELEDDSFRVYCVLQKFGPQLQRKVNFKRCWAAPLSVTMGADGWVAHCCDVMDREWNKLCKHYPEPDELLKVWNSERHRNLVRNVAIQQCPRCTLGAYNEIIEKVIIEDRMEMNLI